MRKTELKKQLEKVNESLAVHSFCQLMSVQLQPVNA